jgi:hypothetical protein
MCPVVQGLEKIQVHWGAVQLPQAARDRRPLKLACPSICWRLQAGLPSIAALLSDQLHRHH